MSGDDTTREPGSPGPAGPGTGAPNGADTAAQPLAADALERPTPYQAAGRTSPWGYAFLAGLAMLGVGVAWWKVEGDASGGAVLVGWFFVSLLLTLAPVAWHAVDFFQALMSRRGAAGLFVFLTLGLGLGVYGIASAINVKFQEATPSVDLTSSRRFSLGGESLRILQSIEKARGTVYATYLEHDGPRTDLSLRSEAQEQLRVYGRASKNVQVRVFEAVRNRDAVEKHLRSVGVVSTSSGEDLDVIVFSYAEDGREVAVGKQKEVRVDRFAFTKAASSFDSQPKWLGERVLTSAIQELAFQRYKLYVTGGHGERSLSQDLRGARERLAAQNLEVVDAPLDLATARKVPDDCDLLLVAGPETQFAPEEAAAIRDWLGRGRTLLLLLDVDREGRRRDTGLETVTEPFGLSSRINYVVLAPFERKLATGEGGLVEMSVQLFPRVSDYADHPAVRGIREGAGFRTAFLVSSFVEVDPEPEPGVDAQPVVYAPELPEYEGQAPKPFAARLSPERRKIETLDPSVDRTGVRLPLVAVASRKPDGPGAEGRRDARIVMCGDTDAFTDAVAQQAPPNLDLLTGLVQWGLGREELVAVSERTLDFELVDLDDRKLRMAFWWPLMATLTALLAGAAVWWARRR